ncbi:MATE efflux family protein [Abeliophyllum distichum]|uniref:MATE efflux family protein n=1 Tax=Abeliophyllum distichum TaxID=126358 RepID=A0ABD1VYR5_9LAMI
MEEDDGRVVSPLISEQQTRNNEESGSNFIGELIGEAKQQLNLAVLLIAVSILQYCLQVISIMFVGHLGELPLSSASMATSFASVTGFSVLVSNISSSRQYAPSVYYYYYFPSKPCACTFSSNGY